MNILLVVDGSAYTKKMLAYLATHDEFLGPSHSYSVITVQAVLPPCACRRQAKWWTSTTPTRATGDESRSANSFERHGVAPARILKVGAVGETIGKVADTGKFDLLVMGSHGPVPGHAGHGLVTTQVLAHSKVPVLIVR